MPEPYAILLQLRRFNLPWTAGGYEDQPHIRLQEMNAASVAESKYEYQQKLNALRRKQYEAQLKGGAKNG